MTQIGGDIESQAVHGDAAADANADGADFGKLAGVVGPDADGAGVLLCCHAELCQSVDDDSFEQSHIPADGELVFVEADDRIRDKLPRAVEGDIAAAVGFDEFNTGLLKQAGRLKDVFHLPRAPAERDYGWMLDQQ